MDQLIQKLQRDLYSKAAPGVIMCDLREKWLDKFLTKYDCNKDALTLGFLLADFKLQEATSLRKVGEHIRMALSYATQVYERYELGPDMQNIVSEIIETHHGGSQRSIEAKLFRNAECMAFLEPQGFLHNFAIQYSEYNFDRFDEAFRQTLRKAEEKLRLVDLDPETIEEANMLYDKLIWIKERSGI